MVLLQENKRHLSMMEEKDRKEKGGKMKEEYRWKSELQKIEEKGKKKKLDLKREDKKKKKE